MSGVSGSPKRTLSQRKQLAAHVEEIAKLHNADAIEQGMPLISLGETEQNIRSQLLE
jgi:hypothetical protein